MDVDKIIYINLAEATERDERMKVRLAHFPADKVLRFEAIKHEKGYIGCSRSHIECLKLAMQNHWRNVLILEDDAEWTGRGAECLQELLANPYDVILLGSTFCDVDSNHRVISANATTAYIVNSHYYPRLLSNFTEGLERLIETDLYNTFAIDQFWKQLQKDRWFLVPMVIQTPGYSYIEKTYVDYTPYF